MRFLGLGLEDRAPDEKTIWAFRERLTEAEAIKTLFKRFDAARREAGFIAMSGQIVEASLIAAPRQRNGDEEKRRIKAGESAKRIWSGKPAKARQKTVSARWTLIFGKGRKQPTGRAAPTAHTAAARTRTSSRGSASSLTHRRRAPGKPLPEHVRRGQAIRSKHRPPVEPVFAFQKALCGLFIRNIGMDRARTSIDLANILHNINRLTILRRAAA